MSAKEKLNERLLRQWASEETLKRLRALEAERDKAWQSLKKANVGFEKYERQFYLVSAQLEQALLDRDTLKAETLRLAKERDQWKDRFECLADPNRDVCEHGADQWTYCVPCEAPYVDEVCIRLTAERDAAIKERDEAVYEARYMFEQIAQSEAIYPERWQASDERAMLISERDSYADAARKARREALEWVLENALTDGTWEIAIAAIQAELARLDAEDAE